MMNPLVFDIETIPAEPLSTIQREELERKTENIPSGPERLKEQDKICGLNPFFGQICVIGMYFPATGKKGALTAVNFDEEKVLLERFWAGAKDVSPVITFNGLSFDVPYIVVRTMIHQIPITNYNIISTKKWGNYHHIDIADKLCGDGDRGKKPSLRLACDAYGIESPKEGGIRAEDVKHFVRAGKINEVADYCLRDVTATYQIHRILNQYK